MHVQRPRRGDLLVADRLDALHVDPVERHAGAEGDGGEDRHLRGRVEAGDVLGRVGLGEPESLRLGQRVAVAAARLHLREDEVRRAVDDAEHAVDVRHDERLAQHLDHRDGRADGRLEAQLHSAGRRCLEQLGALPGHELLVRRHHRRCRGAAARARSRRPGRRRPSPRPRAGSTGRRGSPPDRPVSTPGPGAKPRVLPRVADERPHDTRSRCPVARSISSPCSSSSRCTAAPTVP